jgi:isopentenyl-diphosphate delta-isomerase
MTELAPKGSRPEAGGPGDRIPAWEEGRLHPFAKLEVHRRGLRHPAVSVFVMDQDRTLLQRRAEAKYHTPGLWANACCTHPRWGESARDCAARRLDEELGLKARPQQLIPLGSLEYRADVGGGLVEHEFVELFALPADAESLGLRLDPDEVADTRWITLDSLGGEIASDPERFTPWLRIYMDEIRERLRGGAG